MSDVSPSRRPFEATQDEGQMSDLSAAFRPYPFFGQLTPCNGGAPRVIPARRGFRRLAGMTFWWCSRAVSRSSFLCLAACRTRSSAWDTPARPWVRGVLCQLVFPSASPLRSTGSAVAILALFAGFPATMGGQTSTVRASSSTAPRLLDADYLRPPKIARREISRFPNMERTRMPGSQTTRGPSGTRDHAPEHVAFRSTDYVGTPN